MDSYALKNGINVSADKHFPIDQNTTPNKQFFIQYGNSRIEIKLKPLYINLSNSRIPEIRKVRSSSKDPECLQVSKCSQYNIDPEEKELLRLSRFERGRSVSQDSRIFDFSDSSPQFYLNYKMQSSRRMCTAVCANVRAQNTYLKYIYGVAFLGSLYIIILVLHHGELIRNLTKRVDLLKMEVDDSTDNDSRFYKLENGISNIIKNQESITKTFKSLLDKELARYSADKTGRTDFALESSGGKVVGLTPETENFDTTKNTLFGITLCEGMHGPRAMLRPEMFPGHCWAFKGSKGGAIIRLLGKVKIDAVSLEHIPREISPTGEISSAPKKFVISGLKSPTDKGYELGRYSYDIYGTQVQTFELQNSNYYEYVELRVLSNNDNPDFTCVYRIRVHGTLEGV